MISTRVTITKRIATFGLVTVLMVILFAFHSLAAKNHGKQTTTTISVSPIKYSGGLIQSESHLENTLKSSPVIFDFASMDAQVTSTPTSDLLFLAVNSTVHNPFYAVPTVHAP
jgi:hypothetical protein